MIYGLVTIGTVLLCAFVFVAGYHYAEIQHTQKRDARGRFVR